MKTLHTAYRVTDLERSLQFYRALGYREVGRVVSPTGAKLLMLQLPEDDAVTIELVYEPAAGPPGPGAGFSHIVVQVDDLDATLARLANAGIYAEPPQRPGGPNGSLTAFLPDPDGYRIELVQWPPGHGDGLTDADFA